jgi:hypothetical protein
MSSEDKEYKRLREFLNPAIRGENTEALLRGLAAGAGRLVEQIEAVNEQIFIATATERYLDQRLADYNLVRPVSVGLGDDVFREIGIEVINRKQVRDLIEQLLLAMFGDEATNATSRSAVTETYNLDDGDTLILQFDGNKPVNVVFTSNQFANINNATAQEVSDAITRELRKQGSSGRAFAKDDGQGAYVVLISDTVGPSSSVSVLGGRAQNVLRFERARPTTAGASTVWSITQVSGSSIRFTWTGGANPSIGKVRVGDYANIYGASFNAANRGTYTITNVKSGTLGNAYFEIENANGVPEAVSQGTVDGILFFYPFTATLSTKTRFAAAYQSEARLLEVFIPATTKVVRRERKGAAHLHEQNLVTETYTPGKNEIFQAIVPAPGSISDGQYFIFDGPTTQYYLYFDTTGGDLIDPAPVARTGVRADISAAATAADVADIVATLITGTGDFSALPSNSIVTACASSVGAVVTPAANVDVSGLTISIVQAGVDVVDTSSSVPNPAEGFEDMEGPYTYDPTQPFEISSVAALSTTQYDPDVGRVLFVDDSSDFPDGQGLIILGYGTSHQEGPIPYLARPSSSSILLNPSYRIRNIHPVGTDIALISRNGPALVSKDGTDFPFYITDVVAGRLYAEELINTVAATGITVMITIIYPGDEGLGSWGRESSEKVYIWGA